MSDNTIIRCKCPEECESLDFHECICDKWGPRKCNYLGKIHDCICLSWSKLYCRNNQA